MKNILFLLPVLTCTTVFHSICMDDNPSSPRKKETTQQKRTYLGKIKDLGSFPRKIQQLAAKMGTDSTQSPRSPKTPHSQSSSNASTPGQSPRTPHEEQEDLTQSPSQTQNERALVRRARRQEQKTKNYEKIIAQMRKCILKGDAKGLAKLCNPKTLTPRLFQYIAEATGAPNLQQLLDVIISSNKEGFDEAYEKFFERYGTTPVQMAITLNNAEALLGFGCISGIMDNETSNEATKLLFDAESVNIVQTLIKCGADVNAQNNRGNTFFHECCANSKTDIIKVLLNNGADLTKENAEGQSPFLYKVPATRDAFTLLLGNLLKHPQKPLYACDKRGHNALHRLILSKASADDKVYFARILQKSGVDITKKDNQGNLPHHIWAAYGVMPGAEELIKFAIDECKVDIRATNNHLQTALDLIRKIPGIVPQNIYASGCINYLSGSIEGPLGECIKRQYSDLADLKTESDRLDSLYKYLKNASAQSWAQAQHESERFDSFCKYLKQNTLQSWTQVQEAFLNETTFLQLQKLSVHDTQKAAPDDKSESFEGNSSDLYMHSSYSDDRSIGEL